MEDPWKERRSRWQARTGDARTPFDIDYARVVHSESFRRLQGKTQILNLGDSDFYRTRLTHSLEVAQIGRGIVLHLSENKREHPSHDHLPTQVLIETIGLAHDLGHPPFGHGGEAALNYCMRDHGGFEGNGQTLRILCRLEYFSDENGADLTRRSLLGLLKYPRPYNQVKSSNLLPCLNEQATSIRIIDREKSKPPKCFLQSECDAVTWILKPLKKADRNSLQKTKENQGSHRKTIHKSFDCSIMDIADDISNAVHDFEDAITLGLIRRAELREIVTEERCESLIEFINKRDEKCQRTYDDFIEGLFSCGIERKSYIGDLVGYFITNMDVDTIHEKVKEPLLRYRVKMPGNQKKLLDTLTGFVRDFVIKSPNVQHLEFKGQRMVVSVFEAFATDPKRFLPADSYRTFQNTGDDIRVVCDYVAGMTDTFLLKTYDRLFSPRMGSVFDRL